MKYFILLFSVLFSSVGFAQIEVTFRVDMQYQTVSSNGVHVAGSMQGWNPSSTLEELVCEMIDNDLKEAKDEAKLKM